MRSQTTRRGKLRYTSDRSRTGLSSKEDCRTVFHVERAKRLILDTRKIFELSSDICRAVPDTSLRKDLARRIGAHLSGTRKGRLRLPGRFPESVRELSKLGKSQLRRVAFWVTPGMSGQHTLKQSVLAYAQQVLPLGIWTRSSETLLPANLSIVARCPEKMVPTENGRAIWPSTPDFFEILELSRRGCSTSGLDKSPVGIFNPITRSEFNSNIKLATRIVRRQIVGIRFEKEVPREFLKYFRRLHGFLILTSRHAIPAGLVRFLASVWIVDPTSLWLVENCPFKFYLRRHCSSDFIRETVAVETTFHSQHGFALGKRTPLRTSVTLVHNGQSYHCSRVFSRAVVSQDAHSTEGPPSNAAI